MKNGLQVFVLTVTNSLQNGEKKKLNAKMNLNMNYNAKP